MPLVDRLEAMIETSDGEVDIDDSSEASSSEDDSDDETYYPTTPPKTRPTHLGRRSHPNRQTLQ